MSNCVKMRKIFTISHTFSPSLHSADICLRPRESTFVPVGPTGGLCQDVTLILRKLDVSAVLRDICVCTESTCAKRRRIGWDALTPPFVRFRRIGLNARDVPSPSWYQRLTSEIRETIHSPDIHALSCLEILSSKFET